jgi:hypothetical protein
VFDRAIDVQDSARMPNNLYLSCLICTEVVTVTTSQRCAEKE